MENPLFFVVLFPGLVSPLGFVRMRTGFRKDLSERDLYQVSDCFFHRCHAKSPGHGSNGGGVYFYPPYTVKTQINFTHTVFSKCYALGSGGAFFIIAKKVELIAICISKCFARTNQAFYVLANKLKTKALAISDCMAPLGWGPTTISFGGSGSEQEYSCFNLSHVIVTEMWSVGSITLAEDVRFKHSMFVSTQGWFGMRLNTPHGSIEFIDTAFAGNELIDSELFVPSGPVHFIESTFVIGTTIFVENANSHHLSLRNCVIDVPAAVFGEMAPQAEFADCFFGMDFSVRISRCEQRGCVLTKSVATDALSELLMINVSFSFIPLIISALVGYLFFQVTKSFIDTDVTVKQPVVFRQ